jgi:hypothetical protein
MEGNRSQREEEEGYPDTWAHGVSDTQEETDTRARKLGQRPDSLGSAQTAKRGAARGDGPRVRE